MEQLNTNQRTLPCIWMSAGLLSYKLCDRDLDCEHCPLDAALRGPTMQAPRHTSLLSVSEVTESFPDDRLFSPGHSWVQLRDTSDERLVRFGLDAFAATIIGRCCKVSFPDVGLEWGLGEDLCEIDIGLGVLSVTAPVRATVVAKNKGLANDPNQLVTDPFGDGWIAELQVHDPSQLCNLSTARRAREQTRMDLRRFRRRIALQLLADTEGIGPCLPDGGELADLRQILAGPAYLDLARELVH
jgi:glycine cleavage system H protein